MFKVGEAADRSVLADMTFYLFNTLCQKDLSMTLPYARINRFALSLSSTWMLAAAVQADPRDVSYTYTTLGQIATVDGPCTDVSDFTGYSYDAQGHMTRAANTLNQTTTLSNFEIYANPWITSLVISMMTRP